VSIERRWSWAPGRAALARRTAIARFTERHDGDFRVDGDADELTARRQAVVDRPWTWLHQVHGSRVVVVTRPGGGTGEHADAAVTADPGAALAVQAADCAPVVLVGEGVVGVAHAGWRGLEAGVVANAVEHMRRLGASDVEACIGPCIEPASYEFGTDLLDRLASAIGPEARGRTRDGAPALDLSAAVRSQLADVGIDRVERVGGCTAEQSGRFYSYRARGETGRQAAVVWIESAP